MADMGDNFMRTIETTATVTCDGKLMASIPSDVAPGLHRVVLIIDETPDTQRERETSIDLPVIRVNTWPDSLSLRREDI